MGSDNNEHLLAQLVKLGDMMGDGLHNEPDGKWIEREYRSGTKHKLMELLIDSHRGVHIPRLFLEQYKSAIINAVDFIEEIEDVLEGTDNDNYLDSWETIISKAILKNDDGVKYILHHDEDLWAMGEDETE